MTTVIGPQEYQEKLLALPRPGGEKVYSFYDHRVGAICRDVRLMLIPLDDHLVHRGDGVFETMKFLDRKIYQLDAHLDRMHTSMETIFLNPPCSLRTIRGLILDVCAAAEQERGVVSVFVGRGPGGFTPDFRECPEASLYIVSRRFEPKSEEVYARGVTAFMAETPAKQCYLSRIKSVDYLPNVLMKREAIIKGYDYPFCFDDLGFLAEGATENVVIVNGQGKIVIPELKHALPGTSMLRALELIAPEVDHEFAPVSEGDVYEAREVILLGTTLDALSVVRFNDKPIHDVRPGPVSKRLRELLAEDVLKNGTPLPVS